MKLTILLATYNNACWLPELLDSILGQSYQDFTILARDDGSTDDTAAILSRYAAADSRLHVLPADGSSGSAQNNFFRLLLACDADYVMFADADDVWLPDKIEMTLAAMLAQEAQYGADCPVLVHTDLAVADADLRIIAPSLFRYEKLSPNRRAFRQILVQNNVTGCAVMINRALRELVPVQPVHSVMHDWWLALAAAAFGRIAVVNKPLILYRQHGSNQVGAYNGSDLAASARKLARRNHVRQVYKAMYQQAGCFADTFDERLSSNDRTAARAYAAMLEQGKLGKVASIVRHRFYKNTLLRNIGQFWAV